MPTSGKSPRFIFEPLQDNGYKVYSTSIPGFFMTGNSLDEVLNNIQSWDKKIKEQLSYILLNLTVEDKARFLQELGQYYVDLLQEEIENIPETFWSEWLDVAEFESDKEALKEIRESIAEYDEIEANDNDTLAWEEICQITNSNH